MVKSKTFQDHVADYRAHFADCTLVAFGALPVRLFRLLKPGAGNMGGVDIIITGGGADRASPERIVVTGDLCPSRNAGCISMVGYGLGWFAGRLSDRYLCEKFLREVWVPGSALAWMRSHLEDVRSGELDLEERRVVLLEEAIREADRHGPDSFDCPARSSEAFSDWHVEEFGTTPEDTGFDYDSHDAALLCVIQETFARLYWATQDAEERASRDAPSELAATAAAAQEGA